MKIDVFNIILDEIFVPQSEIIIGLSNGKEFKFNKYYLDLIQDKLLIIQDISEFETYYYFDIEEIVYIKNSANDISSFNNAENYSKAIEKQRKKNKEVKNVDK